MPPGHMTGHIPVDEVERTNIPHAQHVYQVLLCQVVFFVHVPLQSGENIALFEKDLATLTFDFQQ